MWPVMPGTTGQFPLEATAAAHPAEQPQSKAPAGAYLKSMTVVGFAALGRRRVSTWTLRRA
jgi:hypothetical protein